MRTQILLVALIPLLVGQPSWSQQAKKKKIINRYSHTLIEQQDGSYKVPSVVLDVLGDDVPGDLCTPYKAVPRVPKEDVAEVPCEEVVYKSYSDHELKLYIVPPVGSDKPAPVVCFIHGGGWSAGDPSSFVLPAKYVAKYGGLAAVSIGYSLAKYKDVDIQVTMKDLHDAIQYLRDHAEEYNLDTSRLAFAGSSAGGHLSAMMAFTEPDTKVLSGWSGPYDLESHLSFWSGGKKASMRNYFLCFSAEKSSQYSPVNIIPYDRQIAVQLFQGTGDPSVHFEQAIVLEEALKEAGQKTVECNIYPYYGHGLTGSSDKGRECMSKFLLFTKQHIYD